MKIKFVYRSPNTDEPNKKFTSIKYDIKYLIFDKNPQIDFTDGSYLMLNEMDPEYTTVLVSHKLEMEVV